MKSIETELQIFWENSTVKKEDWRNSLAAWSLYSFNEIIMQTIKLISPASSEVPAQRQYGQAPSINLYDKPLAHKGVIDPAVADSILEQFNHESGDEVIAKILHSAAKFGTQAELNHVLKVNPKFLDRINENVQRILSTGGVDVRFKGDGTVHPQVREHDVSTFSHHDVYATPGQLRLVNQGEQIEVTNGARVVLTNGSADVYHKGHVDAIGDSVQVSVGLGGRGCISSGARGMVHDGGKARAENGGEITLVGGEGEVGNGGTAVVYGGARVTIGEGGHAKLRDGAKGEMHEFGTAIVDGTGKLSATKGQVTALNGGFVLGSGSEVIIKILHGGEGKISAGAFAEVEKNGKVEVGDGASAMLKSGGIGHVKAGGFAMLEQGAKLSVEPGAVIESSDSNMVVRCGTIRRKVCELRNFDGERRPILVTKEDCLHDVDLEQVELVRGDRNKEPKSILKSKDSISRGTRVWFADKAGSASDLDRPSSEGRGVPGKKIDARKLRAESAQLGKPSHPILPKRSGRLSEQLEQRISKVPGLAQSSESRRLSETNTAARTARPILTRAGAANDRLTAKLHAAGLSSVGRSTGPATQPPQPEKQPRELVTPPSLTTSRLTPTDGTRTSMVAASGIKTGGDV